MPGKYARRLVNGCLRAAPTALWCVGLRPIEPHGCCEMKRLYGAPEGPGSGLREKLVAGLRMRGKERTPHTDLVCFFLDREPLKADVRKVGVTSRQPVTPITLEFDQRFDDVEKRNDEVDDLAKVVCHHLLTSIQCDPSR